MCSVPDRRTPHTVSDCPRRRQWRADGRVGAAGRASRRRLYCSFMAPHSAPRGVLSMAHTSSQRRLLVDARAPLAVLGTRGRDDLRVHHVMPAGPAGALRPWPCAHPAALLAAWPWKDAIFAQCCAHFALRMGPPAAGAVLAFQLAWTTAVLLLAAGSSFEAEQTGPRCKACGLHVSDWRRSAARTAARIRLAHCARP